jgi:ABC-type multidrug transport system fused ATPase/permease subunit
VVLRPPGSGAASPTGSLHRAPMQPTFFDFIIKYSIRQQVVLVLMTVASFPFLYYSLDLPKRIINDAIGATAFPKQLFGVSLSQVEYLLVLCLAFLALVLANGGFKYAINVYKGRLGERMLRRLRYKLFSRMLRFPTPRFRRLSQGEIVAMITAEVEPLGGFIGDAFALPAFQGGTLLTILTFMFVQDVVLGCAAIALYPLQAYLIPKLQRQVNALAKERVRTVRRLSERIGEAVSVVEEIHVHDTSELHRAQFAELTGQIYQIRLRIYMKKFFIKFLNNFIAQLTPFLFFSIGGYLVIAGDLTFGALVAVLSAYKDLSSPWKELLDWYQDKEDSRIKYEQLIEQFEPAGMLDERLQGLAPGPVDRLAGEVIATNLSLEEEGGVCLLNQASFRFALGDKVAFRGGVGSGAETAAKLLARLLTPTAGEIQIGGHALADLPEWVSGRRLGYVGPGVTLVQGTIRDNLFYGLKHQSVAPPPPSGGGEGRTDAEGYATAAAARAKRAREAALSGNTASDPAADWIDYAAAGCSDRAALNARALAVLADVDFDEEVFTFGLNGTIDAATRADLACAILQARHALKERLAAPGYAGLVEPFERQRFNRNMTVAENLLFGKPIGATFDLDHIASNDYVRSVLDLVHLVEEFQRAGLQLARIAVDLFEGLPPGHEVFQRYSFVEPRLLPELKAMLRRVDPARIEAAAAADLELVMSLPFKLVPARHRLGVFAAETEQRLLSARELFADYLPAEHQDAIAFFDAETYNTAASIQDNILFGKLAYGRQQAHAAIAALIDAVIDEFGLRAPIVEVGLDYDVGVGGRALSAAQRQKLALARNLIKRPDLLILDQALAALEPRSQDVVRHRLIENVVDFGIVWLQGEDDPIEGFDRLIRFEAGRVQEQHAVRTDPQAAQP